MIDILEDARAALLDYIETIEKQNPMSGLYFGRRVVARLDNAIQQIKDRA